MKNKIWIVAQREYATRVKKRSFIILTILMPFLMAAMIFVPLLLSVIGDSGRKTVALPWWRCCCERGARKKIWWHYWRMAPSVQGSPG